VLILSICQLYFVSRNQPFCLIYIICLLSLSPIKFYVSIFMRKKFIKTSWLALLGVLYFCNGTVTAQTLAKLEPTRTKSYPPSQESKQILRLYTLHLDGTNLADVQVSGKVTEGYSKEGLPGVSISVKGDSITTITNVDGVYVLTVPENAVLVFSFFGYTTQEVPVKGQGVINIKLMSEAQTLSEMVVVGYGTQPRREVTGAITKVENEKIVALPTPSFEASLQGRAPGVQVIQGSGLAGSGSVVRVRGAASVSAGGDPLYVMDGIPITQDPFINGNRGGMNQNPLAAINPNDIESIEILKDAAAAIYGSRGANGVILVTTRRGKAGKPSFNFTTRAGIAEPAVKPSFVSGSEWLQLYQEAWENDGKTGPATLPSGITWEQARQHNTDWWDVVTRRGFITNNNFSASLGNEKLKAFLSAHYSDNESFIKNNSFQRYGFRGNFDIKLVKNLTLSVSSAWSRGVNFRVPNAGSGGLGAAMSTALPIYPVYNSDGSYYTNSQREMGHPNPLQAINTLQWRSVNTRSLTNIALAYAPIKNLTIRAVGNLDYLDQLEDQYQPAEIRGARESEGLSERWPTWITNYNTTLSATYTYEANRDHKFIFLLGSEYQESQTRKYNRIYLNGATGPFWKESAQLETATQELPNKDTQGDDRILAERFNFISYFSRINYNLKGKYFFQGILRADGSSRFGINNRYGFFPALSAAWLLSEENFLNNSGLISNLKLRASYGITGNANIPAGQWLGTFQTRVAETYAGNPISYPLNRENPDLKWESLHNIDVGLEFGFWNNRITGEVTVYNKLSKDVLLERTTSLSTGYEKYWQNLAEILNRGVEFSFSSKNIVAGDFLWQTDFTIAHNYNNVVRLYEDIPPDAAAGGPNNTRIVPGYPLGTNFLVRYYGVDPTDGLPIWLNRLGERTKTLNVINDRVPAGRIMPDAFGSFTNLFRYKGFELSSMVVFTIGGNIYDDSGKRQSGVMSGWNVHPEMADRWRQPGDVARFPRLTTITYPGLSNFSQYNSTLFLYEASYLRLRELTLGYQLPTTFTSRLKISNVRLYVTGMNLLTFSKFPGGDPEIARDFVNAQDQNMSTNITFLTAPQQRVWTIGLNIGF